MSVVEHFRAEPLVCGFLGAGDPVLWQQLTTATPVPVDVLSVGARHAFAASSVGALERPVRQRPGQDSFTWGRYVVRGDRPRDAQQAAQDLGLAGLWVDGDEVVLHTDLVGVQDVFVRVVGGAHYFCNRVQPLRDLASSPLTVDWDGWGASLAYTGFVVDSTGFREIRRLGFGELLRATGSGVRRERALPEWILAPECEVAPAHTGDVIAQLREVLPRRWSRERTALTLSGGWDSRLIAMGLSDRRVRRPAAWSITPDTGFDDDLHHASRVAAALRLRHTVVGTHRDAWVRNRRAHLRRLEHMTWLHTWLAPLARRVRAASRPVYDGLAGDVLLRNLVVGDHLLDLPTAGEREEQLWRNLGASRVAADGWLARPAQAHWAETTRAWLHEKTDTWAGLPAEHSLRVLTLRTNRCIGASPRRMLAPEVPVRMPLLDPHFLRVALRVPPREKAEKTFYRKLLVDLDPRIGALPSTNDGPATTRARRRRSQLTPAAAEHLRTVILGDELVTGLLDAELVRGLRAGDPRVIRERLHLLHWAESLADWRSANATRLADTPLPF